MYSKNPVPWLFLLLFFTLACNDAKFNRYPGSKLERIPEDLQGDYIEVGKKDSFRIEVGENYWIEHPKPEKHFLGDSFVLSTYKGMYYFSSRDKESPYWIVMHLKREKRKLLFYSILYDPKKTAGENPISKYFTPTYLSDSTAIFTMDEEQLLKYTQNELLKEKPAVLRRIK